MANESEAKVILGFLRDLASHNSREWFAEHRAAYEEAKSLFEDMTEQLIRRISTFDESVKHLQAGDCTYRIYRDVRFSLDKSPYKRHMGAYVAAHGKKALHGGYYFHLEPGNCLLAGGSYCLPSRLMQQLRQAIAGEIDEYRSIVDAPEFARYFPVIGEEQLKGAPKGFRKDYPYLKYVQPKSFDVCCRVPDDFFTRPGWLDRTEEVFRPMKPYLDFINYTIDEYGENGG